MAVSATVAEPLVTVAVSTRESFRAHWLLGDQPVGKFVVLFLMYVWNVANVPDAVFICHGTMSASCALPGAMTLGMMSLHRMRFAAAMFTEVPSAVARTSTWLLAFDESLKLVP